MPLKDESHKKLLIDRYLAGKATEKELLLFFGLLSRHELDQLIEEHMDKEIEAVRAGTVKPIRRVMNWQRIAVAACIFLGCCVGGYLFLHQPKHQQQVVRASIRDLAPGTNKAMITLANGSQVTLTASKQGLIAQQGNAAVMMRNGYVVYQSTNSSAGKQYNMLTTPLGGQYHIVLADGTNVWLNSASSLRYPTAFTGNNREVEMTGEAYFEVAHNPLKPFRVLANGQRVEVLGTHFNINAYNDEGIIKTDLLAGSVKVTKANYTELLKPGQEAITSSATSKILIKKADVNRSVDWKNGLFSFKRADIKSVMRQLSRWYDVEVIYQNGVPDVAITGTISRNVNASQVLQILSNLDIPFKIEDKKIIIINNN